MTKRLSFSVLIFSLFSLMFVSCSNFMTGKDFLSELQKAIEYNSKAFVKVTIDAPNSCTESIFPAVGEYTDKYKCGDSFTLSYVPNNDYDFNNWTVEPKDAVTFEDINNTVTQVTIVKECEITISPQCVKRLQVIGSTPIITIGTVNRTTPIYVYFNYPISTKSIYWTKEELDEEITKLGYTKTGDTRWTKTSEPNTVVSCSNDENNKAHYYSYTITKTDGDLVTKKSYFKNIDIISSNNNSLNKFYDMPYLEDNGMTLVIPVKKPSVISSTEVFDEEEVIPQNTRITYTIKDCISTLGSKLKEEYSSSFKTNTIFDMSAPEVTIFDAAGNKKSTQQLEQVYGKRCWSILDSQGAVIEWKLTDSETFTNDADFETISDITTLRSKKLFDTKTITIKDSINLTDDSDIECYELTLEPVKNKIYPNQSNKGVTLLSPLKKTYGADTSELNIEFDFSTAEIEGIFKLSLVVKDTVGNSKEIKIAKPYVLVDNIFTGDDIQLSKNETNGRYHVQEPDGRYIMLAQHLPEERLNPTIVRNLVKKLESGGSGRNPINLNHYAKILQNDDSGVDLIILKCSTLSQFVRYDNKYLILIGEDEFGNYAWKYIKELPYGSY